MSKQKRSLGRRLLLALGILVVIVGVGLGALIGALSKPLPKGETGPRADELAHSIEKSIDKDAWERTMALKWIFAGRNRHLWDRQRGFERVIWGDEFVLVDLNKKTGVAFHKRERQRGDAERKLLDKAYAAWINDSFWLNPLVKLFDGGVTRSVVSRPDGTQALLISYSSGGLTPGDSYLWLLPAGASGVEAYRPRAWQMFVSVIPIKGVENSWDRWTQLDTGAWVATNHQLRGVGIKLELAGVRGAATLGALVPGPDPFAMLVGGDGAAGTQPTPED